MVVLDVYVGNERIMTTVTTSGDVVSTWIDSILDFHRYRLDSLLIGVDVKWCRHGRHGTRGKNPIATLQLCVGRSCLIFQLIHSDNIPENLRQFLANNRFRFVGQGIKAHAARLKKDYPLSFGRNIKDIREFAAQRMHKPEMQNYGVRALALVVKGWNTENTMSVRLSDWGTQELNEEQIECAAVDAFLTFTVGLEVKRNY